MSQKDLRGHVADYYERRGPDPKVLDLLVRRAKGEVPPRRAWRAWLAAAAAVLLAAVGLGLSMRPPAIDPQAEAVCREIASHHLHRLEPEFRADSMEELAAAMQKLDFALTPPALLAEEGLRIVGGRYCAVRGRLAAELTLVDARGQSVTLCVARYDASLGVIPTAPMVVDGLRVRAWVEKGLLMGLAVPA